MARLTGSLYSVVVVCHSASTFCHSVHLCLNHSPGTRSSILHIIFCFLIQSLKYFSDLSLGCHEKRTSSKPSSPVGNENLANSFDKFTGVKSGATFLRKFCFFSSSVSSATGIGSSSSSFCSSLTSACGCLESASSSFRAACRRQTRQSLQSLVAATLASRSSWAFSDCTTAVRGLSACLWPLPDCHLLASLIPHARLTLTAL
mmetsp:Transcript_28978/g.75334  ORF Transcript_28978/g.75334 Transcript_28978/m.75334 type:complete len:203 (-) Transcript_28978:855-1463(-)